MPPNDDAAHPCPADDHRASAATEALRPRHVAKEEVKQVIVPQEAAEAASCAKSTFLAFISHDTRNLLSNLLGTIALLRDTELSAKQRRCLAMAESSIDALLKVTNDILDLSKIEAGRLDFQRTPFTLRQQLKMAIRAVTPAVAGKNLRLKLDVDSAVPTVLIGDPGRLRQVLDNLLANAVKFTFAGRIRLSVHVEHRDGLEILLHFIVADTGIGIPKEKQQSIFQPFEQAEGSIPKRYGGTGLGLAICENLVRIMGGRIWLDNQVGYSSTFHFTAAFEVPAAPPHVLKHGEDGDNPDGHGTTANRPLRILLVEDETVGREIVTGLLARRGHVVQSVANGWEAVCAFEMAGGRIDLVLMDIMMPEKDGLDATAEIRARERAVDRHVPIVAMTAQAMPGDRERCLAAGMDAYLVKPVQRQELIELVERIGLSAKITPTVGRDPSSSPGDKDLCDVEQLRDWCNGDERLLRECVNAFRQAYQALVPQLYEAADCGETQTLQEGSHRLTGLAGNLRASAMRRAADHLQRIARSGQLNLVPAGLAQLESEYERLAPVLALLVVESI